MRKLVKVLLVALLAMSLFACGSSFEKDKDAIVDKLYKYAEYCDILGNGFYNIISVTGTKKYINYLDAILHVGELGGTTIYYTEYDSYGYSSIIGAKQDEFYIFTDKIFGTSLEDASNVWDHGVTFNAEKEKANAILLEFKNNYLNAYSEIDTVKTSLQEEIKTFKEKYNKKHEAEVEMIVEYYLLCTDYHDLLNNPNETILSFKTKMSSYQTDLSKLKKKIELE